MGLVITPSGWKHYTLIQDLVEQTSIGEIKVPAGFRTDLASTPRILWCWLPPMGEYSIAAVVHDYLCENIDRKTADLVFYELMLKYRTYKYKALMMYYAVRLYAILRGI